MTQHSRRTFLDSSVLMAAFRSERPFHDKAKALLADESREFLSSSLVELELTQPQFNPRNRVEAEFYQDYLINVVDETIPINEDVIAAGIETVRQTEAAAMDAMHLTCAIQMHADEVITAENTGKPWFRENRVTVRYLGDL